MLSADYNIQTPLDTVWFGFGQISQDLVGNVPFP
jgi:hypothetical protein